MSLNLININNLPSSLLIFCHNIFLSTFGLVTSVLCRWWKGLDLCLVLPATGEHPKQHHLQYANTQHLRDLAQKATINTPNNVQNTFPQFSLHTITIKPKQG